MVQTSRCRSWQVAGCVIFHHSILPISLVMSFKSLLLHRLWRDDAPCIDGVYHHREERHARKVRSRAVEGSYRQDHRGAQGMMRMRKK